MRFSFQTRQRDYLVWGWGGGGEYFQARQTSSSRLEVGWGWRIVSNKKSRGLSKKQSAFPSSSVDIRAAFLQLKVLDRDVFVTLPEDIKKPGVIWRLWKSLYGLDDASCKFWLWVKEVFTEMGLKIMDGDEAFYFLHEEDI